MNLKEIFKAQNSHYGVRAILKWLWRAWRGNRLQAFINASLGLLATVVSLSQVWAVKHAIDVASHVVEGSLYWAVGIMGGLILCDFAINICAVKPFNIHQAVCIVCSRCWSDISYKRIPIKHNNTSQMLFYLLAMQLH